MWYGRDGRPLGARAALGPRLEERERERDRSPLGLSSVELSGVAEAARLGKEPNYRQVALTKLQDGRSVSTVWLGLDHRFGPGPPLIFESLVFPDQTHMTRYSTEAEAFAGHLLLCTALDTCWRRFSRRRKKAVQRAERAVGKRVQRFLRVARQYVIDMEAAKPRAPGPRSDPRSGPGALFSQPTPSKES